MTFSTVMEEGCAKYVRKRACLWVLLGRKIRKLLPQSLLEKQTPGQGWVSKDSEGMPKSAPNLEWQAVWKISSDGFGFLYLVPSPTAGRIQIACFRGKPICKYWHYTHCRLYGLVFHLHLYKSCLTIYLGKKESILATMFWLGIRLPHRLPHSLWLPLAKICDFLGADVKWLAKGMFSDL